MSTSAMRVDHPVADGGDDALGERLARARPPLRVHDVVALAPALDELGDQLGRVLQIAVDHDHRIAARGLEAGDRRHRLAEPAREAQHLHARVLVAQLEDQLLGAVRAGIDAEDQLPLQADPSSTSLRRSYTWRDVVLLVVGGDDDAEHRASSGRSVRRRSSAADAHGSANGEHVRPRIPNGSLQPCAGSRSRHAASPRGAALMSSLDLASSAAPCEVPRSAGDCAA